MKKIVLVLAAILLAISASAIPAKRGAFTYTQPDGSVVRLELHGDEFFSWHTLAGSNQAVALDKNGYWRKTSLDKNLRKAAIERRREINKQRIMKAGGPLKSPRNEMALGTRHIPVLLVAFSDLDFVIPNPREQFDALLNEKGYSANGATGSVCDYYNDNSHGLFQPIFDVYGPVTLSNDMAYYGGQVLDSRGQVIDEDARPAEALREGCLLLDSEIDFTQYDSDNDGMVDMVLFYFAGYNQAEGGPEESIWPHQDFARFSESFDGLQVGRYFCSSELAGFTGTNMDGIGTTCHEFAHSIGLPDFYDTDYDDNGGENSALGYFSLMDSGCYLHDGHTPPYLNSEERIYLGWLDDKDIAYLPEGDLSFGSVKDGTAYRSATDTDGEYFLYECRDKSGWDRYLPRGLVIYHVDKSNRMLGGITAENHWTYWEYYNDINVYGGHPLFYVVPAFDQQNLYTNVGEIYEWVFPGDSYVTSFMPVDWEGDSSTLISDISFSDGKVNLNTRYFSEKTIIGQVLDMAGNAVAGAKVVLTSVSSNNSAQRNYLKAPADNKTIEVTTESDGSFTMNIEEFGETKGHLTCSKDGYLINGTDVDLFRRLTKVDLKIRRKDQGDRIVYSYFDPTAKEYISGDERYIYSQMGAIRIPAASIPEKGGSIISMAIKTAWWADCYYVVVDADDERLYTVPVNTKPGPYQTIDLSSYHLAIPGGKDIYVGFAYENIETVTEGLEGYMFFVSTSGDNFYTSPFNLTKSEWTSTTKQFAMRMEVQILETIDGDYPDMGSLLNLGICAIADPKNGKYANGDSFPLNLVLPQGVQATNVSWAFDGKSVSEAIQLTRGEHIVSAAVKYADGSEETLELKITVK